MNIDYDARYDIRLAEATDKEDIMTFISQHWKKNHILSTNHSFFAYEQQNGSEVNFILAIDKESKEIEGILGFLYASSSATKRDIWCVIWKVKENAMAFLGVELKKRLKQYKNVRTLLGVGVNPKTALPIEKVLLKFHTDKMKHFYLLSPQEEYHIAVVKEYKECLPVVSEPVTVKEFQSIEEVTAVFSFEEVKTIPLKDSWYVNHRYFQHPIYQYTVCGIFTSSSVCQAVIVFREVEHNNRKVLRIIDYIGEQRYFATLGSYFQSILPQYEYIDFYCAGFEDTAILKAGFRQRKEEELNIIPDYFSPFLQENIDIWVSSSEKHCTFFKGDGDQDRPNS